MMSKKLFDLKNEKLFEECHVIEDISHMLYDCPEVSKIRDMMLKKLLDCHNISHVWLKQVGQALSQTLLMTVVINNSLSVFLGDF